MEGTLLPTLEELAMKQQQRQQAEQLAEKLRALGINPEEL
ncbi:hypothetical protein THII_0934 [Thioploca ingrica]|uniref:Uncharacterized protein n=1 Tax=Thioploca ingrica TaxID=40754 RepID=A0A090BUJ8_9GAMM|nr:hypothetical protein THII_0934 [Thioploca ingrica]